MKILLRSDVDNVGRKGEIHEVRDGYARNYLIPHGKALRATSGTLKQAEDMRRAKEAAEARFKQEAQEIVDKLHEQTVQVPARAGKDGKLFGSITSSDIASALNSRFGVEVDKRKIQLKESIRTAGTHEAELHLHPEAVARLTVEVTVTADK